MKRELSKAAAMRSTYAITSVLLFLVAPVFGQIPDTFSNLKVLPADISKQELVSTMRSFAMGLGVRCEFCHVGEPGQPLSSFDFASDEKSAKQTARTMMEMVQQINSGYLSKISGHSASLQVSCVTCHRKQSKPRMLENIIAVTAEEVSTEAAIQKYRDLREKYYGGFSYDFSDGVLNDAAQILLETKNYEGAIALLKLNLEFYPENVASYYFLGEAYATDGNKELAIQNFERVLSLQPNNRRAKNRIEALKQ